MYLAFGIYSQTPHDSMNRHYGRKVAPIGRQWSETKNEKYFTNCYNNSLCLCIDSTPTDFEDEK